jgi:hypothetical protein
MVLVSTPADGPSGDAGDSPDRADEQDVEQPADFACGDRD